MRICVVALGKIGLPLAVQFAHQGHTVVGADLSAQVVDLVNAGQEPFPGEHQLLTTGRHLLITVTVVQPKHGRVALAKRVAKATIASHALPGPGRTLR